MIEARMGILGDASKRSGALLLGGMLVLPAPRTVVYGAFSDSEMLAKWWGPEGFTIESADLNIETRDTYRMELRSPQGTRSEARGEILRVDPPKRLQFSFGWEVPNADDVETVVSLMFNELGGATAVRWGHGRFLTEARRASHRQSWAESLDRLESLVMA